MLNIEARWLLGEVVPCNKSIANFRKDNAKQFRAIFRKFVFLLKEELASNNPDIFPITQFVYNSETDCYSCPAG